MRKSELVRGLFFVAALWVGCVGTVGAVVGVSFILPSGTLHGWQIPQVFAVVSSILVGGIVSTSYVMLRIMEGVSNHASN